MEYRNKAYRLIKTLYRIAELIVVFVLSVAWVGVTLTMAIKLMGAGYIYTAGGLLLLIALAIYTRFIAKKIIEDVRRL
ncbi:hypothetical protein ACJQWY_01245 [Weissella kandleri]|uniref:hypothetical protein n=1 Tax=Weissella kandleri TaxID=1616 RepID=UPI00387ECABC